MYEICSNSPAGKFMPVLNSFPNRLAWETPGNFGAGGMPTSKYRVSVPIRSKINPIRICMNKFKGAVENFGILNYYGLYWNSNPEFHD